MSAYYVGDLDSSVNHDNVMSCRPLSYYTEYDENFSLSIVTYLGVHTFQGLSFSSMRSEKHGYVVYCLDALERAVKLSSESSMGRGFGAIRDNHSLTRRRVDQMAHARCRRDCSSEPVWPPDTGLPVGDHSACLKHTECKCVQEHHTTAMEHKP